MVGVIDYDAGNVKSVMKAVEKLGGEAVLTADPAVLDQCSSLILPGVGCQISSCHPVAYM